MQAEPLQARTASVADISGIVSVHRDAFPGFFLTRMGPRFLAAYYRAVLAGPDALAHVIEDDGAVVGFAVGTTDTARYRRRLLRNAARFILPVLAGVLSDPRLLGRVLFNVRSVGEKGDQPELNRPSAAELASIAVSPTAGGRGLGRILLSSFIASARDAGTTHVQLTTERDGNDRVNQFYCDYGFSVIGTRSGSGGRCMNVYEISAADTI